MNDLPIFSGSFGVLLKSFLFSRHGTGLGSSADSLTSSWLTDNSCFALDCKPSCSADPWPPLDSLTTPALHLIASPHVDQMLHLLRKKEKIKQTRREQKVHTSLPTYSNWISIDREEKVNYRWISEKVIMKDLLYCQERHHYVKLKPVNGGSRLNPRKGIIFIDATCRYPFWLAY